MHYTQYGLTAADEKKKRRKKRRKRFLRFVLLLALAAVLLRPSVFRRIRQLIGRLPVPGLMQADSQLTGQPDTSEPDAVSRPERSEQEAGAVNEALLAVMRDAALDFDRSFSFDTGMTECRTADQLLETVNVTFTEMMRRDPELFWITGGQTTAEVIGDAGELGETAKVEFVFADAFSETELQAMFREMKQEAKRITDTAPKTGSDYEKALFVHDYLVEHTAYDLEGCQQDGFQLCYTAYGALINHSAVCQGYSAAYQYLLRELGVHCLLAGGTVKESARSALTEQYPRMDGSHTWNCVELDGEYYWVDVTWDDPLDQYGQEVGGPVRHEYCFVDDNKIFASRVLSEEYADLPVCTDMTLNDRLTEADRQAAAF